MKAIFDSISKALKAIAQNFKKADSKEGIKETGEALVAVNALSCLLIKRFKDGVGMDDVGAILDTLKNDEEFKTVMLNGADKATKIPAEIKDIDLGEGLELAAIQIDMVPAIIEAAKKEPKAEEPTPA